MKSATVAFGLFAGLASATYNHPRHFHHQPYWRRNETTPAVDASTTMTVAITSVHTVTSCAASITNCPAATGNSTGPAIITEVIDLTTTVCPATAAESISSSMVGAHSSGLMPGTTRTVTVAPQSTPAAPGVSSEVSPEATSAPGVSVYPTVSTADETLSVTVGPESSRSVMVTTIKSTKTMMVTVTASAMPGSGSNSGSDSQGSGSNAGSGNQGAGDAVTSMEGTTTTVMTSTGTRTVTVKPSTSSGVAAEETGSSNTGSGSGSGSDSGSCDCAASTVTVTETMPASTVYVTAPAAGPTGAKEVDSEAGSATTTSAAAAGSDTSDESSTSAEESDVTAIATQTVVPYPISNGTTSAVPSGAAIPTVVLRH